MSADARSAVASAAYSRVNDGMKGLTALQTQIGGRLNRVDIANTALNTQKALVQNAIDRIEGVDPTEAACACPRWRRSSRRRSPSPAA